MFPLFFHSNYNIFPYANYLNSANLFYKKFSLYYEYITDTSGYLGISGDYNGKIGFGVSYSNFSNEFLNSFVDSIFQTTKKIKIKLLNFSIGKYIGNNTYITTGIFYGEKYVTIENASDSFSLNTITDFGVGLLCKFGYKKKEFFDIFLFNRFYNGSIISFNFYPLKNLSCHLQCVICSLFNYFSSNIYCSVSGNYNLKITEKFDLILRASVEGLDFLNNNKSTIFIIPIDIEIPERLFFDRLYSSLNLGLKIFYIDEFSDPTKSIKFSFCFGNNIKF